MKAQIAAFLAFTFVVSLPPEAFGWGATGHRLIGILAAKSFPDEIPDFLRSPEAIAELGELAREPDRSKASGPTHDNERDPGHYVDLNDDLTVLRGPSLKSLPVTRQEYDTALRAVGATQYKAGYLPYSIVDGWQQLRTDFAYWRVLVAAQKTARESDRAWLARDQKLREELTIRDLGTWSHYVGDGSQPMHVSVHYDGWGDYPNPEGFPSLKGFHARFEGAFVRSNVSEADIAPLISPYRDCGCAIDARTAGYLAASNAELVPVYRLEKAHAFENGNSDGKAFVAKRLAAATAELRDMVVDAWRASEASSVGYPPVAVKDVEAGKVDPLPSLMGKD
jgi:hypothetical protein